MTTTRPHRLSFDFLSINVTRRCNMNPPCAHCMRGDPQNLDIDHSHIDNLLDQTEMIEELLLSGGEPFLNVPTIHYLLNELRRRNIPLYHLSLTSNGLTDASIIQPVFEEFYEYITSCRSNPYNRYRPDNPQEPVILLEISYDHYHHISNYPKIMSAYKAALSHLARVTVNPTGLVPSRLGNAESLLEMEDSVYHNPAIKKQIAMLDSTHKPLCQIYRTWRLTHPDQIVICCPVQLSCKGNVLPLNNTLETYTTMDDPSNYICAVTDDIYDGIINYNVGKPDCIEEILLFYGQDFSKVRESKIAFLRQHADDAILLENIQRFFGTHQTSDVGCDEIESIALNDEKMPYDRRKRILDNLRRKTQEYDYTQPAVRLETPEQNISTQWDNREAAKWRRIYAEWIDEGRADNILTILKNKGLA